MAGKTPALQQNWQSPEKSQHFKEKNTIFNEHPVVKLESGEEVGYRDTTAF